MNKVIIYGLLLGVVLLLPLRGEDVGKLLPVEVAKIHKEEDIVVITTDVGAEGSGTTVEAAMENLKRTTAGIIFLDTADYLLIDDSAKEDAHALNEHLKPSVRIVRAAGVTDLKDAAAYLAVHKPAGRLRDYEVRECAEILTLEDGRLILKEN